MTEIAPAEVGEETGVSVGAAMLTVAETGEVDSVPGTEVATSASEGETGAVAGSVSVGGAEALAEVLGADGVG